MPPGGASRARARWCRCARPADGATRRAPATPRALAAASGCWTADPCAGHESATPPASAARPRVLASSDSSARDSAGSPRRAARRRPAGRSRRLHCGAPLLSSRCAASMWCAPTPRSPRRAGPRQPRPPDRAPAPAQQRANRRSCRWSGTTSACHPSRTALPAAAAPLCGEGGDELGDGDLAPFAGAPLLDLDLAVDKRLADHDDRRHAEQVGVGELLPRGRVAVVEQHLLARGFEVARDLLGRVELLALLARLGLADRDDVHVVRRNGSRPDETRVIAGLFGDRGHGTGHTDAVGPHRDPDRLAFRSLRVELERVGVLATELEDVADLDATRDMHLATAARTTVTVANLDRAELARGLEVTTAYDVGRVLALDVGACHPRTAGHYERVDDVAHTDAGQQLRADVAAHELRLLRQIVGICLHHLDRFELSGDAFEVDLAIAGHAHHQQLPVGSTRCTCLYDDVLQRVSRSERATEVEGVEPVDQRVDRRRVRSVEHDRLRMTARILFGRRGDLDGFGVGRVVAVAALHERVLTVVRRGEELLTCRSTHGARHGKGDAVVETEPLEDPLIGNAMVVVGLLQARVVEVEGVGVLHHELAAAQQTRARTRLVAVLGLDLVERHRIVAVGRVLTLHESGE